MDVLKILGDAVGVLALIGMECGSCCSVTHSNHRLQSYKDVLTVHIKGRSLALGHMLRYI